LYRGHVFKERERERVNEREIWEGNLGMGNDTFLTRKRYKRGLIEEDAIDGVSSSPPLT
jgi:hypothetical protein